MDNTYNLGRVVGWSTYEEFLKENDIDPSLVSEQMFQTIVTYGCSRIVNIPLTDWTGDTLLTRTIPVPGAIYGVVPIVGLDYTAYQSDNDVINKGQIERAISNIFSCYVSNINGVRATNPTMDAGYITFCAYPSILDSGLTEPLQVIVRGLGVDAVRDGHGYFGPEGFVFAGNAFNGKGSPSTLERALPTGGTPKFVDADATIDYRTHAPGVGYIGSLADCAVEMNVIHNQPLNSDTAFMCTYAASTLFPSALYGALLNGGSTGTTDVFPIDCAAPGTIKLFPQADTEDDLSMRLKLNTFEDTHKFNYSVWRNYGSRVWTQRDVHEEDGQPVINWIPVSDDETVSTGSIVCYNTRYLWLCSQSAGGGDPSITDLRSVTGVVGLAFITGTFSQSFLQEYGVELDDALAIAPSFGGGEHVSTYINQIPVAERSNYVCIFVQEGSPIVTGANQNTATWVINKTTGLIATALQISFQIHGMTSGFNIAYGATAVVPNDPNSPNPTITYDSNLTRYLGTWWNKGGGTTDELCTFTDNIGNVVGRDHPKVVTAIHDADGYYQESAAVPKAPEDYEYDFVTWFSQTPLNTVITSCGTTADALGIHSNYRGLSFQEFLQESAMRDVSQPRTNLNKIGGIREAKHYIFPPSSLPAVGTPSDDWGGQVMRSSAVATIPGTSLSFFGARKVQFNKISFNGDNPITGADITGEVNDVSNATWVAQGTSGYNFTQAISLLDNYGSPLPLRGTAGSIESDHVTWDNLLKALNHNQHLNVLGHLQDLKHNLTGAGENYIELGGIRLYISNTPPEGDIPQGSIGIGW